MAEVRLVNVSKVYDGGVRAVDSVDVVVPDRSFTVLVGPSGCGKSTLLRMVAGLEEITDGELSIDGRIVNDVSPRDRDIAMVFQNYALYPHMTVYDNMGFSLKLRGASKSEIEERVREAAAMLGLEPYLERLPKALSGGQRQRVAVGRAIVRKPKVFLFDEPLSNLDAKMRVQTRAELVRLHRRLQATMIYVTHDQAEAMTMGDQIVVLRDGRVQQVAPPIDVYNNPRNAFVAGFIGSPPMNFLRATVEAHDGAIRLRFAEAGEVAIDESAHPALREHADGRSVLVGVRPEDVRPDPPASGAPSVSVTGNVDAIEMMGSEQYVSVTSGEMTIIARVDADDPVAIDERRTVHLNLGKARLFDPETESAITV